MLLCLIREETDTEISRSMLHPILFPILLFLSRLQPLSLSRIDPGADDISNMFIEPVMSTLGHVHQKVRIASARALSVLCSGDSEGEKDSSRSMLIEKCIKLLSSSAYKMAQTNHNLDHGALLALKYLLLTCSTPQIHFGKSLMSVIVYYASWGNFGEGSTPPACVAIALEIWQIGNKGSEINAVPSNNSPLSGATLKATVHKIVQYVEMALRNSGESVIALASLGSCAAKIAVETLYPCVFSPFLEETSRQRDLDVVKSLLCSNSYDVMLQSVKSFKKKICESVDSILDDTSSSIKGRIRVLECVYQMLISSLFHILKRDSAVVHPPTIRRISRCIIETAIGYIKLSGNTNLSQITEYTPEEMFQQFVNMLALGSETNMAGSNVGNTLELMSLAITELCTTYHESYTVDHFERDLAFFVDSVKISTSPESNWKVRYSAAISVKESGLLRVQVDDSNPFFPTIQRFKMKVYFQMVQLLQDGDEDVRKAAAVALLPDSHNLAASLRNLEIGYDQMYSKCSSNELFEMLSHQIIDQCQNVEVSLAELIDEFHFTVGVSDLSGTKNLSTNRKIFEEEDSNTFEEVSTYFSRCSVFNVRYFTILISTCIDMPQTLLIIHLSIHKLTQISKAQRDKFREHKKMFQNLIVTCRKMLEQMKEIPRHIGTSPDIAHDVTWGKEVFSSIHA